MWECAQPLTLCRKPTKSSLSGLVVVQPSVGLSKARTPGPSGGPPCCWGAGSRLHCVETLLTGVAPPTWSVAPPTWSVAPGGWRSLSWEQSRDCSLRSRCIFCSGRRNQTQSQPVKTLKDKHGSKLDSLSKVCARVGHSSWSDPYTAMLNLEKHWHNFLLLVDFVFVVDIYLCVYKCVCVRVWV